MKVFAIILLISMMFTAYGMELERVPADSDVQKLPQLPPLSANTAKKVALNLSDIETGQYNKPAAEYSDRELALLILLSNHQSDQTHLISALEEILKTEKPKQKRWCYNIARE